MSTKPRTSCCEPCGGQGLCRVPVNCCIECHMAWEEEMVRPYVPPSVLEWLKEEHEKLERLGFPQKAVLAHSIAEEALFRKNKVPEEVMDQILVDHEEYEAGRLLSRNPAVRATTPV